MNNNTEKRICTVESCNNEQHSKGLCRRHYRLKNMKYCGVDGCTNVHYARNYCSRHYRILYRKEVCKVEDCGKPVNTRGYCTKHYRRFMKYGDTSIVRSKKVVGTCKAKGCSREINSLGYCTKHYQRYKKYGTTSKSALSMNIYHDGKCSVNGCDGVYHALNLCETHYNRQRKKAYLQTKRGREITRNSVIRRRARKQRAPLNDFSVGEWRECLEHFGHKCAYCGKYEKVLDREHVTPISKGGANTKTNVIPSCGSCNYSKGNKTIFEWYHTSDSYCEKRKDKILKYLGYKTHDEKVQMQLF